MDDEEFMTSHRSAMSNVSSTLAISDFPVEVQGERYLVDLSM